MAIGEHDKKTQNNNREDGGDRVKINFNQSYNWSPTRLFLDLSIFAVRERVLVAPQLTWIQPSLLSDSLLSRWRRDGKFSATRAGAVTVLHGRLEEMETKHKKSSHTCSLPAINRPDWTIPLSSVAIVTVDAKPRAKTLGIIVFVDFLPNCVISTAN